jgi:hypothetical protein
MDDHRPSPTDVSTNIGVEPPTMPMTSSAVSKANTNMETHSLVDITERFVVNDVIPWKTSSPVVPMNVTELDYIAGTNRALYTARLPQAILEKSQTIREKMNQFMLLHCNIRINIQVNANKFQQGMLMVVYLPKIAATTKFRNDGCTFLASLSSFPHRNMLIEKENALEFEVPYASTVDHIELTNPDDAFGELRIYVLSTLMGQTSAEEVSVTVKLRFTDVQLHAPTQNSLNSVQKYRDLARVALNAPVYTSNLGLQAQMAEGEKEGPVTKIANTIATVSGALSGIPLISEAATVVGWFARGVANIATAFGYSKPTDMTMPVSIYNMPGAYMGNTEGKDASRMLAQIHDNGIDASDMIPSKQDEMALSYIFGRPNMIARITVPKEDFARTQLLFSWAVAPFNHYAQQIQSDGQDFCFGTFAFASCLYRQWRGSINYSLTCSKTSFHAGRMVAVYFPNSTRSELPPVLGELLTTNSNVVLDLSADQGTAMDLSRSLLAVFTSALPWKQTMWKNAEGKYRSDTLITSNGCIGIYCLNDLVCPETVAQEITFILHAQAGKDYEVSIPSIQLQGGFAPVVTAPIQQKLVDLINEQYSNQGTLYVSGAIGDTPDIFEVILDPPSSAIAIQQGVVANKSEWLFLDGEEFRVPDGSYSTQIRLDFTPATLISSGDVLFTYDVRDGQIDNAQSFSLQIAEVAEDQVLTVVASVPLVAQMDEGAVIPTKQEEWLVHPTYHNDLTKSTTGEYCKSLRGLTKSFIHTRNLNSECALTPVDYQSFDTATVGAIPNGTRVYINASGVATPLPESWLSLASYIYVFCAGSFRSKVMIPWDVISSTSMCPTTSQRTEFGLHKFSPEFKQAGVVNPLVETTTPFYSQVRANVIGGQPDGLFAKQAISFSKDGSYEYMEAAGEDYSMWFLRGPPVMRPYDVVMTAIPNVAPPPVRRSRPRVRVNRSTNSRL